MKEITLHGARGRGLVVLVDDEDFDRLNAFRWYASNNPGDHIYARRTFRCDGRVRGALMHRELLGAASGTVIDHRNHNGLDNRRENLRICTPTENARNARPTRGGTSCFKGVSWAPLFGRWRATIKMDGRQCHLGLYDSEEDAAAAYDTAARKHFADFACTNTNDGRVVDPSKRAKRSKYRGVSKGSVGTWQAFVHANGARVTLGSFKSEEAAAAARASVNANTLAEAASRKARRAPGKNASKLTIAQVANIRARFNAGESRRSLSREFAVTYTTIDFIVKRITWKDVA